MRASVPFSKNLEYSNRLLSCMHCGKRVRRQRQTSVGTEFSCEKCEKLRVIKKGQAMAKLDKEAERQDSDPSESIETN